MPEVTDKPCPFCGQTPMEGKVGDDDCGYYAVECVNCNGSGGYPFAGAHAESKDEARKIWNSRPPGEKCEWKESSDMEMSGTYETTCGQMFTLSNEEGPTKNGFKFCAYCGKELIEVPRSQEIDED